MTCTSVEKVTSFIIAGLQQQNMSFDYDYGFHLFFIRLWKILGKYFLHEIISDTVHVLLENAMLDCLMNRLFENTDS